MSRGTGGLTRLNGEHGEQKAENGKQITDFKISVLIASCEAIIR